MDVYWTYEYVIVFFDSPLDGNSKVSTANLRSLPPASEQSPFGAAGYRLLDFSALLEHLIHYLRDSLAT